MLASRPIVTVNVGDDGARSDSADRRLSRDRSFGPANRVVFDDLTVKNTIITNNGATETFGGAETVAADLTSTNIGDGVVATLASSIRSGHYTAPPYSGVASPQFAADKSTADASLVTCTGANCGEVVPQICAKSATGTNGAYSGCFKGPVTGDASTWTTSVTTPLVTSAIGSLTLQPASGQDTLIGEASGRSIVQDDLWVGGHPSGATNQGAHKLAVVDVADSALPTSLASGLPGDEYLVHGVSTWGKVIARATADNGPAKVTLYKTRATDASTKTAAVDGDTLGQIAVLAPSDGATVTIAALIQFVVDGAVSSGVIPTDIVFMPGGAEALRCYIDQHCKIINGLNMNSSEISSTADPSTAQAVATKHFITSNSASLFSTTTQGTVPATGGSTGKYLKDDGTWATVSAGVSSVTCGSGLTCSPNPIVSTGTISATASPSPSVSIPAAVNQSIANVDLNTLGTIDWFSCANGVASSTTEPHMQIWRNSASYLNGGFFARSFGVVKIQNWDTAASGLVTLQTPAADGWTGTSTATLQNCETWAAGSTTGFGFAWQVPASSTQQVMRLYLAGDNATETLTCKLSISGTTASDAHNFGTSGAVIGIIYTVTFTGGVPGDQLSCRWMVTSVNTTPIGIDFGGASLGLL